VEDYKAKGYLPEALVNFVALLGWNPTADREVYAKEELVREFDLGKVNKAGAVFSLEKLDWMNGEYLKAMSTAEVASRAEPFYLESGLLKREGDRLVVASSGEPADELIMKAVELEKRRVKTLREFPAVTEYLFQDAAYDPKILVWKKSTPEVALARLTALKDFLAGCVDEDFVEPKALEAKLIAHIAAQGWSNGEALWPLRVALSGREASPSPFEIAWTLGKAKTLERIDRAIKALA
jgi:glutamyl/glutaminyl-tRNA synthetase